MNEEEYIEADSYSIFVKIMDMIGDFYSTADEDDLKADSFIDKFEYVICSYNRFNI